MRGDSDTGLSRRPAKHGTSVAFTTRFAWPLPHRIGVSSFPLVAAARRLILPQANKVARPAAGWELMV